MILPLILIGAAFSGGDSTPAVRFVPTGDSVVIFVVRAPRESGGFVVYRGPAGGTPVRLTPAPITPAADGAEAAGVIGADFAAVSRAVRAVDPEGVLRHLQSDPFSAAVLSGLYRGVARALGRLYVDGVMPGATYTYRVVFTDAAGKETARAVTATVTARDVRPAAPRALAVSTADHQVKLTWTYPRASTDSTGNTIGFVVYRADGPAAPFHRVSPAPLVRNDAATPTFVDPDAQNGVSYRYAVTALDLAQREGPLSLAVTATAADRTAPDPVAGLVAAPAEGVVTLAWRRSPESDAAGYLLERGRKQGGPFTRMNQGLIPVDHPGYADTTAGGIAPYFYRVLAQDRNGNVSAPSTAVEALPVDRTPPDVPGAVRVETQGRRIVVRWHPSRSRDVLGYNIYRTAPGPDRVGSKLVSTPLADTVFIDSSAGILRGHRYIMGVSAVDSARNESGRSPVTVVIPDDAPPPPPTGLSARDIGGRYAGILWSASAATDIARYELTRAAGDSTPHRVAQVSGPPPYEVRDTSVARGRTYVYRVVAVDSAGNRSAPALDTLRYTRPTPPPAPRHVAVRSTPPGTTVLWERVADPELAGYRVYRSVLPTGVPTLVGSTAAGVTSLADPAGKSSFYYVVRAVDRSGNESTGSPAARAGSP